MAGNHLYKGKGEQSKMESGGRKRSPAEQDHGELSIDVCPVWVVSSDGEAEAFHPGGPSDATRWCFDGLD
jgi:hypothetical protein